MHMMTTTVRKKYDVAQARTNSARQCGAHDAVVMGAGGTRQLLDDVSGYVAPGKLTALVGSSGAGKVCIYIIPSPG